MWAAVRPCRAGCGSGRRNFPRKTLGVPRCGEVRNARRVNGGRTEGSRLLAFLAPRRRYAPVSRQDAASLNSGSLTARSTGLSECKSARGRRVSPPRPRSPSFLGSMIFTPNLGIESRRRIKAGELTRTSQARERDQLAHLGEPAGRGHFLARQAQRLTRRRTQTQVLDLQDLGRRRTGRQLRQRETAHCDCQRPGSCKSSARLPDKECGPGAGAGSYSIAVASGIEGTGHGAAADALGRPQPRRASATAATPRSRPPRSPDSTVTRGTIPTSASVPGRLRARARATTSPAPCRHTPTTGCREPVDR
jgi:hypothetical protein